MEFLNDLFLINKVIIKKANKAYVKNLMLIPATWLYLIVYSSITIILSALAMNIGEAGGFIVGLAVWMMGCFVLSDYLEHINSSLVNQKFEMGKIKTGGMIHFNQVLSATAIPNIVLFLIGMILRINISYTIVILVYICFAIPEVVYQRQLDRLDIFTYGYRFFKENWKHWLLVNSALAAIGIAIYYLVLSKIFLVISSPIITFISKLNISYAYKMSLITIVSVFAFLSLVSVVLQYIMIYRGFLFKVLSVSSLRKREYMRNIYGK